MQKEKKLLNADSRPLVLAMLPKLPTKDSELLFIGCLARSMELSLTSKAGLRLVVLEPQPLKLELGVTE